MDGSFPMPRSVKVRAGSFAVRPPVTIVVAEGLDDRLQRAVDRFANALPFATRRAGESDGGAHGEEARASQIDIRGLGDGSGDAQAYRLRIDPHRVVVQGADPAGLFYGLQTLRGIAASEGARWGCRLIEDRPVLALRGLSVDVSRGRVPATATLTALVDRLAAIKINHLQLYVEHTFCFQFDPEIARGCSGLTPDDVVRLDGYCRDRFIDLVPSLACFGHMGRILSLPRYRGLAEVPAARSWEAQSWRERIRGLTLNPRDPQARRLVETMLDEYLPLFSSGFVNVCADETHDLGMGVNRGHCRRVGRGRLYVDHLRFLANVCRRHGRRMMFWADVVRSFPERVGALPEDVTLLDWGYAADAEFPAVGWDGRGSRGVCVCPGTWGWNRVVNGLATAEANIDRAAATAEASGADGLIVADWGDHGHFNMPGCSMPAIVRAAARGWNGRGIDAVSLDRSIERHLFGARSEGLLSALRDVGRPGDAMPTWVALYGDPFDPEGAGVLGEAEARAHRDDVDAAMERLGRVADSADIEEWRLGCQASSLLARKAECVHALRRGKGGCLTAALADDIAAYCEDYARVWRSRYRPERLSEVVGALGRAADALRGSGGVRG